MGCRLSLKESSVSIFRTSLLTQNVFFSESPVCIQACTRWPAFAMASFRCNGLDAMDYNELTTCDIRLSLDPRTALPSPGSDFGGRDEVIGMSRPTNSAFRRMHRCFSPSHRVSTAAGATVPISLSRSRSRTIIFIRSPITSRFAPPLSPPSFRQRGRLLM